MRLTILSTVAALAASLASTALAQHEGRAAQNSTSVVQSKLRHHVVHNRRVAWRWEDKAGMHRSPTSFMERRTPSLSFLRWMVHRWHDKAYAAMRAVTRQGARTAGIDACLRKLIDREGSGWDPHATNGDTGAYGLPQALPGSKMRSAGADWADNPATQIRWMIGYVNARYGGSCNALAHSYANGWY